MPHAVPVTQTDDHTVPVLIGSAHACAALGVDRSTLTRWVKAGKIAPVGKIGRHGAYVFTEDTVNRAAAERASFLLASMSLAQLS